MAIERSEKHELAQNSLPDDLKPVFDAFVDHCRFIAPNTTVRSSFPTLLCVPLVECEGQQG